MSKGTACTGAKIDGTESRKIVSVAAGANLPYLPRWSPDGSRSAVQRGDSKQWHVTLGSRSRRKKSPPAAFRMEQPASGVLRQLDARWQVFPFPVTAGWNTNIWAIREGGSLFRKVSHEPVQLTAGPTSTYSPLPKHRRQEDICGDGPAPG